MIFPPASLASLAVRSRIFATAGSVLLSTMPPFYTPSRLKSAVRRLVLAGFAASGTGWAQDGLPSGGNPRSADMGQPAMVFFPPIPPPLGRPVSKLGLAQGGRQAPPAELTLYINDVFYPPLSTRLAKNDLPAKLRQKLETYRATKTRLLAELHQELARDRADDPGARRTALEALARRQAAPLAQLERTAEELRSELITSDTDWSTFRQWRLGHTGSSERGDSPNEVAQVMRATAYYQAGLLSAQRRLLREIALEVAMSAEDQAKAAWSEALRRAGGLLGGLTPVILSDDLPGKGHYFRLRIRQPNTDAATEFCADLKSKGLACFLVPD